MPLKEGKSKRILTSNVRELIRKYKRSGRIGKTSPKSLAHARKIALAAAFNKQRKS